MLFPLSFLRTGHIRNTELNTAASLRYPWHRYCRGIAYIL